MKQKVASSKKPFFLLALFSIPGLLVSVALICVVALLCFGFVIGNPFPTELDWDGLETFSPQTCSVGYCYHLFPADERNKQEGESFLNTFAYTEGNFAALTEELPLWEPTLCREIAYLTYSPGVYEEAKQYALDNFVLSEENRFSYNGYVFIENITYASTRHNAEVERLNYLDENGENKKFPQKFNMFAYNDEKKTLVFLGFYYSDEVAPLTNENIGDFLKEYYYIYDFDT